MREPSCRHAAACWQLVCHCQASQSTATHPYQAYSSLLKAASTCLPLLCHPSHVGCPSAGPSSVRMGISLPLTGSLVRHHTCTCTRARTGACDRQ